MQTPVIINLNHLLFMLIFYNIFSFDSSKIALLHREFSLNFTTGIITTAFWILKICYALKKKKNKPWKHSSSKQRKAKRSLGLIKNRDFSVKSPVTWDLKPPRFSLVSRAQQVQLLSYFHVAATNRTPVGLGYKRCNRSAWVQVLNTEQSLQL